MKCVFAGEMICSYRTLQIMASFATRIVFIDMPGGLFGDTLIPGRKSEARRLRSEAGIIQVDAVDPLDIGTPRATIEEGVRIDLQSSRFLSTLVEGAHSSGTFADRATRVLEACGIVNPDDSLKALLQCDQRQMVLSVCSSYPAGIPLSLEAETLRRLAIGFSVLITSGLFVARVTGGVLIFDDIWLMRLHQTRNDLLNSAVEDQSTAESSEHQVAFILYSESQLSKVEVADIVGLRLEAGDSYASWIEKLGGSVIEITGVKIGKHSASTLVSRIRYLAQRIDASSTPLRELVQKKFGPPGAAELMPSLRYVTAIPVYGEFAAYKPNDPRSRSDTWVPCLFIPGTFPWNSES